MSYWITVGGLGQYMYVYIQGLIQAVFNIGIPILVTLSWASPNLILSKTEATIKPNSSFSIKTPT